MRIAILDDNRQFRMLLKEHVKDIVVKSSFYGDDIEIVNFQSSKEFIDYLSGHEVDILFLDISMPEIDGFDVAKYINDNNLSIYLIFVSSFESNVFYSLRYKPFRFIRKEKYKEEVAEALKSAYIELTEKNRYIMITKHSDIIPVRISRIIYAEKEKRSNYISIYCQEDNFRYRGTLSDFEALVRNSDFVKASQNAYINMAQILNIKDNTVSLRGGYEYYLSPKYKSEVLQSFFKFMREE